MLLNLDLLRIMVEQLRINVDFLFIISLSI